MLNADRIVNYTSIGGIHLTLYGPTQIILDCLQTFIEGLYL